MRFEFADEHNGLQGLYLHLRHLGLYTTVFQTNIETLNHVFQMSLNKEKPALALSMVFRFVEPSFHD